MVWVVFVLITLIPIIAYIWGYYFHKEKTLELYNKYLDTRYLFIGIIVGVTGNILPKSSNHILDIFLPTSSVSLLIIAWIDIFIIIIFWITKKRTKYKLLTLESAVLLLNIGIGIYIKEIVSFIFIKETTLLEFSLSLIGSGAILLYSIELSLKLIKECKRSSLKFYTTLQLIAFFLCYTFLSIVKNKFLNEFKVPITLLFMTVLISIITKIFMIRFKIKIKKISKKLENDYIDKNELKNF